MRDRPLPRAALALVLFTTWLALLFAGFALGGAVHLLLAGSLALFPWRALPTGNPTPEAEAERESPPLP
jgi:hypothetical protein